MYNHYLTDYISLCQLIGSAKQNVENSQHISTTHSKSVKLILVYCTNLDIQAGSRVWQKHSFEVENIPSGQEILFISFKSYEKKTKNSYLKNDCLSDS